jgi:hypothetical protein
VTLHRVEHTLWGSYRPLSQIGLPRRFKGRGRSQGLPRSAATLRFAEELLARTPAAGAAPSEYRERERQAAALVRANAAYALLSDDEDDGAAEPPPAPTTAPGPKPAKQKKLRKAKAGPCSRHAVASHAHCGHLDPEACRRRCGAPARAGARACARACRAEGLVRDTGPCV